MTKMAKLFEREGANIVKIGQNIDVVGDTIDSMIVSVVVDTKDKAHQEQIITELNQNFYVFKANYNDTQF